MPNMIADNLPSQMCAREEYDYLARYVGKPPHVRVILMSNGVKIGYGSNQYFYVSPVAHRVAAGHELSGRTTKTRNHML